jgi:oligopeptide transport system substrate-binding protein
VDLGGTGPRPASRLLIAGVSACLVAAACTSPPPEEAQPSVPVPGPTVSATPSTSLRLATGQPASLDPRDLDSSDSLLLASQVFDGLVAYDPTTLEVIPAAAESWEVQERGRRFVFHLRRGATFHDGSPVRAQDFAAAWNRLADPVAARPFAFLLEQVEGFAEYQESPGVRDLAGVVVRNDLTLEVTLVRPWLDFPFVLGHPALSPVPPGADRADFPSQPVGNGPYRVAAPLAPGSPVIMERSETYDGTTPAVPSIEYVVFEEPQQAWPEFLAGELDLASVPPPLLAEAQGRFGSHGVVVLAQLLYCGLNQADPRFRDRRLRQAVSLALDRETIAAEVYGELAVPAGTIVPPTIPGHRADVCADRCLRDVDRARRLASTVPRKDRTIFLDYPSGLAGGRLAELVAQQLGQVGITVEPRPHDQDGLGELLREGSQEMVCLVWAADYPHQHAFLDPLLASGSADNHVRVRDEDLDTVLERARTVPDAGIRREAYVEAERLALQEMYLVPVVWFRSHLAVQPGVQGFVLDPMGRYDAATLQVGP